VKFNYRNPRFDTEKFFQDADLVMAHRDEASCTAVTDDQRMDYGDDKGGREIGIIGDYGNTIRRMDTTGHLVQGVEPIAVCYDRR